MSRITNLYKRIDQLRARYYELATKQESLLQMIAEAEVAEQVYNSNAIENSTLSLEETEKILLQIELDRAISQRELFEARNLARVVEYITIKAKSQELTLDVMTALHGMLLAYIRDEVAGRFRQANEYVRVGSHIAAHPHQIPLALQQMLTEYHANTNQHIVARIARLHLTFEHIHPFVDGNGRIGRVLNNYLLIREGYVPINIKFIDRAHYYDAFKTFDQNRDIDLMTELVGKALSNSYHKRLAYLEGKTILPLGEVAKKLGVSHASLINKAKRQTIPAFVEKGVWKMGV